MIEEQRGAAFAESLLVDLGFETLPIMPRAVVDKINDESFNLQMEDKNFISENILGKAIGNADAALIYLNSNIPTLGRYNFTAAHEIGHVCMHIMYEKKLDFNCGLSEIFSTSGYDNFEKEANGFASGLLMPKNLISELTDGEVNWQNIYKIKKSCKTSIEATFRRLSVLSKTPIALIIHEGSTFKRFAASDNFEPYIGKPALSAYQKGLCSNPLEQDNFDRVDAVDWVNPKCKYMTLEYIYSSSIALNDNYTYTLLTYDDDCFIDE